jgi:phosphoserine aminotransferase
MSQQKVTFNAGPSKIPKQILHWIKEELYDFRGTQESILELPHRSAEFSEVMHQVDQDIRDLLHVPDNYKILMLQGGGRGQFDAIPMNLGDLQPYNTADYVVTGSWSSKSADDAARHLDVNLALPKTKVFRGPEDYATWNLNSEKASYLYYCANETIEGVEFPFIPETPDNCPLICDMSSCLMTRPFDVSKYGLIFAGSQKTLGCAGVTSVIVRDDLLESARKYTPGVLNYKKQAGMNSVYNTPPTFNIYVLSLTMRWLKEQGGIEEMEKRAIHKSNLIYNIIDDMPNFYSNPVDKMYRSRVNIPFRVGSENQRERLEKVFLAESKAAGLYHLKGHRSVGGMRASIYNAHDVERSKNSQIL